MAPTQSAVYSNIEDTIQKLDLNTIPKARKSVLQPLVKYIQAKVDHNQDIRINFICTHNSRRSHLSQVWAQTLASYFELKNVFCYSGGTEATALFPAAAKTLKSSGFKVVQLSKGVNPVYSIKYSDNDYPVIGFSKTYDAEFNPVSNFAAIMTCSSADAGCPFIAGAELRLPMTYEDPKAFDHTPQQMEKYNERSLQIATELKYVFSKIKTSNP